MKVPHIVLAVFALLLTNCVPNIPPNISSIMITSDDIPSGWVHHGINMTNEWGGINYVTGFGYGDDVTNPAIRNELIVYSDKTNAIKGYEEYKNWIYTDIWVKPSEANFTPLNPDDLFEYKCDGLIINKIPVMDCLILQQHESYVSTIQVRMGNIFSYDILKSILKIVDNKLNNQL